MQAIAQASQIEVEELVPAAFTKDVMLAAARHDQGVDLHSELVLARARGATAAESDSD